MSMQIVFELRDSLFDQLSEQMQALMRMNPNAALRTIYVDLFSHSPYERRQLRLVDALRALIENDARIVGVSPESYAKSKRLEVVVDAGRLV
jgi:hypothetical protein